MSPRIKDTLGVAVVIGIFLFAYAAITYSNSFVPGANREFSVSGEGKVVAVPDIAAFTFSVITEGDNDLGTIQKNNTEKANSTIAFLKSKDVDAKDIKTEGY
ncbi:MAG: SIMPL domain-containing protein, partial [Candidatus Liptonbacteria bacterium]